MPPATRAEIVALFQSGSDAEVRAFFASLPGTPHGAVAPTMALSGMRAARSIALSIVTTAFGHGRSTAIGIETVLAAYDLLREDLARFGPQVVQPFTVSQAARDALQALENAGRYAEMLSLAGEATGTYGDEPENGASIRVARVGALCGLQRFEEALPLLVDEERRGITGPAVIELRRLGVLIRERTGDVTTLKTHRAPTEASEELARTQQHQLEATRVLREALPTVGDGTGEPDYVSVIAVEGAILADPAQGRSPARIRAALEELEAARRWARDAGAANHENDALWQIYLCYSRLRQPAEAAAALQAIRANHARARALTEDPMRRVDVGATFPQLYGALCMLLTQCDDAPALLEAIEGTKGRAVIELLARRGGHAPDEGAFTEASAALPMLMRDVGAHYVSYFVDHNATYAVLVAKDGSMHHAGAIPLTHEHVRAAASDVDPRRWEGGPPSAAVDVRLEPLLAWLEPHWASGLLAPGDHLCYSPDEHLHHVPLHFVRFRGAALADAVSVSRVHGAAVLTALLGRPLVRPASYVAIEVATADDALRPDFLERLAQVRLWLEGRLPGRALRHEEARPETLARMDLRNRLVHFATHGRYPRPGGPVPENPYHGSGLLLAGPNGLPERERVVRGDLEAAVLTPEKILDLGLDFSGSHVTLQACVSALAAEGLGGDALGLDWALMQAGASSLLASHWDVGLRSSAEFFERFFDRWLLGDSRARAWRHAIVECRRAGGDLARPECWAAFSLSGDWR